jgi:hypothetical protein
MGTFQIVYLTPFIESLLTVDKVSESTSLKHFGFKGAMEPLIFALGLRVVRPSVRNSDAQTHKPNSERGIRTFSGTPLRAVIHDHSEREAIAAEYEFKTVLYHFSLLTIACFNSQSKARMVIKNGQRITLDLGCRKVALEVHLPEHIGGIVFKSLPGLVLRSQAWVDKAVPTQDSTDGAGSRNIVKIMVFQPFVDFTSAPGRMLPADGENGIFYFWPRAGWRMERTARFILKSTDTVLAISAQPFIAGARTYHKPSTNLSHICSFARGQRNKLLAQRHGRHLFPRHKILLLENFCLS